MLRSLHVRQLRSSVAVALATVSLATIAAAQQPTPTVALMEFNASPLGRYAEDYASLGSGIPHHLGYSLASNAGIRLVDRSRIQEIIREQDLGTAGRLDNATMVRVGRILGAQYMLAGSFIIDNSGTMEIVVTSTNMETSQISNPVKVTGRVDKVLELLGELATKLNQDLKLPAIPAGAPRPEAGAPANVDQRRLVLLEGAALKAEDRGDIKGAVELWKQVAAMTPSYEGAKVRLAKLDPPR